MTFRLIGILGLLATQGLLHSQTALLTEPHFDVATIKLNPACKTGRMPPATQSPGRWKTECSTLQELVRSAFLLFANGVAPDQRSMRTEIVGGPDWIRSDYYALEAKADGRSPLMEMLGPMTQALIKDRFHLKFHMESAETKVYALTLAKNGLKVKSVDNPKCIVMDFNNPPPPAPPGQTPPVYCGERLKGNPQLTQLDYTGISMDEFAARLAVRLDRDVVNRTGVSGVFDLHLEFTPDETTPGFGGGGIGLAPGLVGAFPVRPPAPPGTPVAAPAGPSMFSALEGLGLKLVPTDGTRQILVIDSVDRPIEN